MKTKNPYGNHGGWAVDGVEYPTLKAAAQALGEPEATLRSWFRRLDTRRATSAELSRMRRNAGSSEWQRLSDSSNTGAGRGELRP